LPRLHRAAEGRLTGAHFGTYDYTANCDITAAHQKMRHPACDFAKHVMKVSFAGTGVMLSDGATNIMPVAPHRGHDLSDLQKRDNKAAVFAAWRIHADDAGQWILPGLGSPPRAAADPLRRGLRVLPRRPGSGVGAPEELRRQGRAGHARRRHLRRRGDRAGPAQLLPARHRVRRRDRGGSARDRPLARRDPRQVVREDHGRSSRADLSVTAWGPACAISIPPVAPSTSRCRHRVTRADRPGRCIRCRLWPCHRHTDTRSASTSASSAACTSDSRPSRPAHTPHDRRS